MVSVLTMAKVNAVLRSAATAACLFGLTAQAVGQVDERLPTPPLEIPITGATGATGTAGKPGWSAAAGASGHPAMAPAAISAAAANFGNCVEGLWPLAARRGIARAAFEQHTAGQIRAAIATTKRELDKLVAQGFGLSMVARLLASGQKPWSEA